MSSDMDVLLAAGQVFSVRWHDVGVSVAVILYVKPTNLKYFTKKRRLLVRAASKFMRMRKCWTTQDIWMVLKDNDLQLFNFR